jgi:hypothetical protein
MKSVIKLQRHRLEYGWQATGEQSVKRWLLYFKDTGNDLHKMGACRPSADGDTVNRFRDASQSSQANPSVILSENFEFSGHSCRVFSIVVWNCMHRESGDCKHWNRTIGQVENNSLWPRSDGVTMTTASWDVIFSDESTLHASGMVNRQNCGIWGSENPHVVREFVITPPPPLVEIPTCRFPPRSDWTRLFPRESSQKLKLPGYTSVTVFPVP